MTHRLARSRGLLVARAVAALAFGAATLAWADVTVTGFATLFAGYAVFDGLLTVLAGARYRSRARDRRGLRSPLLALGAAGMTLGLVAAVWPSATMRAVLGLVAAWAAVTGGSHLGIALRQRGRLPGSTWLAAAGAAGLALALLVAAALAAGEVRVGWQVGLYGVTVGALLAAFTWRLPNPADDATADDADGAAAAFAAIPSTPLGES